MTVLVGVKCTDGVVIGADSMATSSMGPNRLIQLLSNDKVQLIGNMGIMASTGSVGLSQRFKAVLDSIWRTGKRDDSISYMNDVTAQTLNDFGKTHLQSHPPHGIGFGALHAMIIKGQPYLFEFGTTDFQPEIKQGKLFAVSLGSGQLLADPFLAFVSRVLWKEQEPTVRMAKVGVYWVLDHTIQYAPGGVGKPIKLAVLEKTDGVNWQASVLDDTQEQAQYIKELEEKITLDEPMEGAIATEPPTPGA